MDTTHLDLQREILEYSVAKWKERFTGTSALDISNALRVPHPRVVDEIRSMVVNNLGTVNETKLWSVRIAVSEERVGALDENTEGVDTVVFFPARRILEEAFHREGKDYGPFTNRLHQGDSQIKHYFFDSEVLERYFRHPERYHLYDDVSGGQVMTKDAYYFSLPEAQRDAETFGLIRYGKRRLENGQVAVAVIVNDLSDIPIKEQRHWESHEIVSPKFASEDREFEAYWRGNIEGEFLEREDPLQLIIKTIKRINALTGSSLFQRAEMHPQLYYPLTNTVEAYIRSHKELFKLIGTDSLSEDVLQVILSHYCGFGDLDFEKLGEQGKRSWTLFKELFKCTSTDFTALERCHQARIEDAHKIPAVALSSVNYAQRFRDDCAGILGGLKCIEAFLKSTKKHE